MDKEKTVVIFKKDKENGEIVAFMPYLFCNFEGNFTCYAHIGQHSECSFNYYSQNCVNATESEYKALADELSNIGYNLDIKKKMNYDLFRKAYLDFIENQRKLRLK